MVAIEWRPDSEPCFEAWQGEPFADGVEQFTLRLQIPLVEGGRAVTV